MAEPFRKSLSKIILLFLLWSVGSSLWYFPHSLSYFNELAGGPRNGHAHLIHTNIDWGQDLLFLQRWLAEHQREKKLYLAYYGFYDPSLIGVEYELPPTQASLRLSHDGVNESHSLPLQPGLYAVSVNLLRGHKWKVFNGRGERIVVSGIDFSYFLRHEPVAMAGYSIYIFEIDDYLSHAPVVVNRTQQ